MIKAALYPRVSTQEQAKESHYSIGEQIERMKAYCSAMGWIVYNTYTDAGFSGGNTNRPGLQAMISDVKAGKVDKVVVYKLDRLSRSQKDALFLIEDVFIKNGVDFVSITENFSCNSAMGRAFLGIAASFSQLEREQIKERMTMGKQAKIKDGFWIGTVPPFGYDYDKKTKRLEVNEDDAAIVRELFQLFNDDVQFRTIETIFQEKGYLLHGNPFRIFTIKYIAENKVYAGYLRSGDGWTKGVHDPIITEEDFEKAQKRIEKNKEWFKQFGVQTNGDRHTTLLGGLIYCKQCGARFGKRWNSSGASRHPTYCCYSRMKVMRQMVHDPACKNKYYRVEVLDEMILNEIRKLSLDPSELNNAAQKTAIDAESEKKLITKNLEKIEKQISRFLDLYGIGRLSVDELDKKLIPLEEQRNQLKEKLEQIPNDTAISQDEAVQILTTMPEVLEAADKKELRRIVESLIERIDIDADDIFIKWRF